MFADVPPVSRGKLCPTDPLEREEENVAFKVDLDAAQSCWSNAFGCITAASDCHSVGDCSEFIPDLTCACMCVCV